MSRKKRNWHDSYPSCMELNDEEQSRVTGCGGGETPSFDQLKGELEKKHGPYTHMSLGDDDVDHHGFLWKKRTQVSNYHLTFKDGTQKRITTRKRLGKGEIGRSDKFELGV